MRVSTVDPSRVMWRKSSLSTGGDCVEVAVVPGDPALAAHKADADELYLVRDSKDPNGPALAFTQSEWDAFVGGVKAGEFD
ncbi:hypothetical protein GCM10014719_12950 [Planomonospora parontospora subsp. antibiotica]|uniref:DUF397 domain-containing protein n=1 Tax=Planomonospora parontospora TaxID=58119 RepID=UPI0016708E1D|nr:hypothetical protein GCM10014719_12950 [Planomonospora parontospora subsp. antibiotica]GII14040.1 hypothetical protein Ppa05_07660 [Planomonospora parontospora subsp. antibiotica]